MPHNRAALSYFQSTLPTFCLRHLAATCVNLDTLFLIKLSTADSSVKSALLSCLASVYHIAGNFRGVLIFVIFVTDVAVTKFCTPQKFAIVGKDHQAKSSHECAHNRDQMHGSISGISVLLTMSSTIERRITVKISVSVALVMVTANNMSFGG